MFAQIFNRRAEHGVQSRTETNMAILAASGVQTVRHEGLVFAARHRVLADVAVDLSRSLPENHGYEATIFLGLHMFFGLPDVEGARLGIQTEQLLDAAGTPMWRAFDSGRRRRLTSAMSGVLDFSLTNAPAYADMRPKRREKIMFGPYVFPSRPVPFRAAGEGICFAGSQSGRRAEIIAQLKQHTPVDVASRGTFGAGLAERMQNSAGVLNIHFAEGVYSEVPRILKAYLAGKILYSEELADPFVAGRHYLPLSDLPVPSVPPAQVHENFQQDIASRYPFTTFLETALSRA